MTAENELDHLHNLVMAAAEAVDAPCSCSRKAKNRGDHDDGCWQVPLHEALDAFDDHYRELVPGELLPRIVDSAPERIFLPISDDRRDLNNFFNSFTIPGDVNFKDIKWCEESSALCKVEYVRSDLVDVLIQYAWRRSELADTPGWLCPNCKGAHGPEVETCPVQFRRLRDVAPAAPEGQDDA